MASKPRELREWSGKTVDEIREAYSSEEMMDKYESIEPVYRFLTGRYRSPFFSDIEGRVLDVACGAGVNFEHVPADSDIVGIDINDDLLEMAGEKAAETHSSVELQEMDAQDLNFEDDSFDTVISTLSSCTFPDPIEALNEMARVCRPDGQIRLIEHGKANFGPLAWYQQRKADDEYERTGCRLYDDPVEVVDQANIDIVYEREWMLGTLTGIVALPSA